MTPPREVSRGAMGPVLCRVIEPDSGCAWSVISDAVAMIVS